MPFEGMSNLQAAYAAAFKVKLIPSFLLMHLITVICLFGMSLLPHFHISVLCAVCLIYALEEHNHSFICEEQKTTILVCCLLLYCFHLRMQQERPRLPEDVSPDLAFVIQACWVEDPNLRPTFSQIIRMLNSFYFKLSPPSPPSPPLPDTDNNEAAASNGTMSELSVRTRGKFSFLRQLFNAKKNKNSQ